MAKVFSITEGLEVVGALSTGGQGSVYKARRQSEVTTAVKIIPTPIHSETADDKNYASFQNEVAKLQQVSATPSPHVVRMLSHGIAETGSFPFIEMEFIEGPDLEELLKPPHPPVFTVRELIKVADQLSAALAHCHKAGVKHGDLKSNNIKYDTRSGNYILLDFGMALLSDEQRRTTMRGAGAVEFMAPEQVNGSMLMQTDVYALGVVLFELAGGRVPFPLGEGSEMARNAVMLAHMEAPLPDVQEMRQQTLALHNRSGDAALSEPLPRGLVDIIHRCLEKDPRQRFADGIELHAAISRILLGQSTLAMGNPAPPQASVGVANPAVENALRAEVAQLRSERQTLQQELSAARTAHAVAAPAYAAPAKSGGVSKGLFFTTLLLLLGTLGWSYWKSNDDKPTDGDPTDTTTAPVSSTATSTPANRTPIGEYKVIAERAYFHNEPDASTRRSSAWLIPSYAVVKALDERNGFIYTEFKNSAGKTSKGWVLKEDLMTVAEWAADPSRNNPGLNNQDVKLQLAEAKRLLNSGRTADAAAIYNFLADSEVPEAMYGASNLGLQQKNPALNCGDAFDLLEKAANKNHTPAKRTLGFLYLFADQPEVLRANGYDGCTYDRSLLKGTRLMMEAIKAGDSTARRLLDQLQGTGDNAGDSTND